jgi:hypothetical protein
MNCYKVSTPRAAIGLISLMMSAVTIGALVVLPAQDDWPARVSIRCRQRRRQP